MTHTSHTSPLSLSLSLSLSLFQIMEVTPNGAAAQCGLSQQAVGVNGILVNWIVTEINGRPVNLQPKSKDEVRETSLASRLVHLETGHLEISCAKSIMMDKSLHGKVCLKTARHGGGPWPNAPASNQHQQFRSPADFVQFWHLIDSAK